MVLVFYLYFSENGSLERIIANLMKWFAAIMFNYPDTKWLLINTAYNWSSYRHLQSKFNIEIYNIHSCLTILWHKSDKSTYPLIIVLWLWTLVDMSRDLSNFTYVDWAESASYLFPASPFVRNITRLTVAPYQDIFTSADILQQDTLLSDDALLSEVTLHQDVFLSVLTLFS